MVTPGAMALLLVSETRQPPPECSVHCGWFVYGLYRVEGVCLCSCFNEGFCEGVSNFVTCRLCVMTAMRLPSRVTAVCDGGRRQRVEPALRPGANLTRPGCRTPAKQPRRVLGRSVGGRVCSPGRRSAAFPAMSLAPGQRRAGLGAFGSGPPAGFEESEDRQQPRLGVRSRACLVGRLLTAPGPLLVVGLFRLCVSLRFRLGRCRRPGF